MNKYCLLVLLFFVTVVASAQERKISGTLTDRDTHDANHGSTLKV